MSVNAETILQDVELFITTLKQIVPSSLLSTVLGSKLSEVEEALNIIATVIDALQKLEGPTTSTAPAAS